MALRTINLEAGLPTLEDARRYLIGQIETARNDGIRLLKVIHGYGSSGAGGVLCTGIRKSLRLRVKEGKALTVIPGERFSSDSVEARTLVARYPALRRDHDFNRANPGITIVELTSVT
jgi:hypothetical protein